MAGAARVYMNDLSTERLSLCREVEPAIIAIESAGLKEKLSVLTRGQGVSVCITAAPSADAQILALEVVGVNGRVMFFGGLPEGKSTVPLDTNLVHYKQITITGTSRQSLIQYRQTLALVASGRLVVKDLVTMTTPLDQIRGSFDQVMAGQGTEERHRVRMSTNGTSSALFVGIDIGTQGVKAAVYDNDGLCLGEAFRKSELLHPVPGVVEEDPERQVQSTCEVIAECAARAVGKGTVRALAIDGQMAGIIGVGDDGRHVTPYDSWLDTRCSPWIERMQHEAGAEIVRKAGGPPASTTVRKSCGGSTSGRRHTKGSGPSCSRAATLPCGCAGWRAAVRSSTRATSISRASPTRAQRPGTHRLCRRFGVDQGKLPRIVASHDIVGGLVPAMAKLCGLPAGTPGCGRCGDTAASFLSCGATRPGICVDVAGTGVCVCSHHRGVSAPMRRTWSSAADAPPSPASGTRTHTSMAAA